MIPHDLSRGAELQPQYFEEGNHKPDPSWGRKIWFISPWQSRLAFLGCSRAVWPPCPPSQGWPGLQRCQRVKELFFSRSLKKFGAETLKAPEAWRGQKGREAGLAAAFAVVADLNSIESNRSVFVTNVQNFQAWCINNGIFSFQPQCLNSVGFSDPSQLKGYLFKFSVEIWITINTQKK